jgi:DNA-binding MarR family transcriptional regulator
VPTAKRDPAELDLHELPGHLIRRLQQIAVAVFLQETESLGVTPVQFAALQVVAAAPGIDQRTLSGQIGLDTSTVAGVVDRLESRGFLTRAVSSVDRRARVLMLTNEGVRALSAAQPAMWRAQERILAPLPKSERREFVRMLKVLVESNNDLSRAPSEA